MKLKNIIYAILLAMPLFTNAQEGFNTFLDSIAANNKTIASAKLYAEASKTGARTGIYLPNPTVSYDRLNSPSGNYSEMLVTQSFDFPTVYRHKGNIATLTAQQAEESYRQTKLNVFNEAASVFSEIVSTNRKLSLLYKREQLMEPLQTGSEKKLQTGESNIFEVGRIRTEAAKLKSEKLLLENRKTILIGKLTALYGGSNFTVNDTLYPVLFSTTTQDSLLTGIINSHPQTKYWQSQSLIAERNIKLQKALSLPKFEIGYRQDINAGQNFNGIHAGISIPLFENKNTVRTAKAQQLYAKSELEARKLNVQNTVMQLFSEYTATQKSVSELTTVFENLNTPALLLKAYSVGQINYTEFFSEYGNFYQMAWYLEELKQKENELQLQLYVFSTSR